MAVKTDKRSVLRMLGFVRGRLDREISGHAARDRVAAGLSGEGYAGGYRDALSDVEAALRHGHPSDRRGYWREAREVMAAEQKD